MSSTRNRSQGLIRPEAVYPVAGRRAPFALIDVRAPLETARGALPDAYHHPILSDAERHLVGIRYHEAGSDRALALGWALTEDDMPNRVAAWREVCERENTAVYCWRGGLRSQLAQDFIGAERVFRIEGGYKAVRRYLIDRLGLLLARKSLLVIGGLTGVGKTELLEAVSLAAPNAFALDLEAHAKHRGSAFGKREMPQPSQASFENVVASEVVLSPQPWLVVEDESRSVGRVAVPDALFEVMQRSPVVLLEASMKMRVERIFEDYVREPSRERSIVAVREGLEHSLNHLRKRLSDGVFSLCQQQLADAERTGRWFDLEAHATWIQTLLETYYDPRYLKGLRTSDRPVAFRGGQKECLAWIQAQTS